MKLEKKKSGHGCKQNLKRKISGENVWMNGT